VAPDRLKVCNLHVLVRTPSEPSFVPLTAISKNTFDDLEQSPRLAQQIEGPSIQQIAGITKAASIRRAAVLRCPRRALSRASSA